MVSKSAVIGIDLGSSESYVAYVGKGVVDVVQNEVSKRSTPTLVGFTDRERLLGDTALAQIKSNAKNTCRNFKHLLGRKIEAPDLEKESFWSTSQLLTTEDGLAGYAVNYKGEPRDFSAIQITAMYLTKLRDVSEKWCQAKLADVVIAVPSYFSDMQRQALLDAARIAGISVLSIMNEHTATALAYGIYRTNDFDPEKPITVAFCSMGHAIFSVAIVQFIRGKLTVLCEKSGLVGGRDMDECLMREFAAQFRQKTGNDPLANKKAAYKLEDAVTKTKKILSANSEANLSVECLMEDEDFASQITRSDFEKMCAPAIGKAKALLHEVIAQSPVPVEQIHSVEVVGGASRVPWVKALISEAFRGKELSTTMNQEESVARGCALQAAILSPLFKVRDFKVEDSIPFPISLGWTGGPAVEDKLRMADVFPANTAVNILKILTFHRTSSFEMWAQISDEKRLLPLTPKELGTFRIEIKPQQERKKIKVRVKITPCGTFVLDGAQLVEEEEYEEAARREADENSTTTNEANSEAELPPGANPEVQGKKKTRIKRIDLKVVASGRPGLSEESLQRRQSEEIWMQSDMREVTEINERRNDVEEYILTMRKKVAEGSEYGAFISAPDREAFNRCLSSAEEWLYDNPDSTKVQLVERLDELQGMGEPVAWRCREDGMRDKWVATMAGKIQTYRNAAETPGPKAGHIPRERLGKIVAACCEAERWLLDMKAKQDTLPKYEKPVLLCADMERKTQELARLADDVLCEARPIPPRVDKEEAPDAPPQPAQDEPVNFEVD